MLHVFFARRAAQMLSECAGTANSSNSNRAPRRGVAGPLFGAAHASVPYAYGGGGEGGPLGLAEEADVLSASLRLGLAPFCLEAGAVCDASQPCQQPADSEGTQPHNLFATAYRSSVWRALYAACDGGGGGGGHRRSSLPSASPELMRLLEGLNGRWRAQFVGGGGDEEAAGQATTDGQVSAAGGGGSNTKSGVSPSLQTERAFAALVGLAHCGGRVNRIDLSTQLRGVAGYQCGAVTARRLWAADLDAPQLLFAQLEVSKILLAAAEAESAAAEAEAEAEAARLRVSSSAGGGAARGRMGTAAFLRPKERKKKRKAPPLAASLAAMAPSDVIEMLCFSVRGLCAVVSTLRASTEEKEKGATPRTSPSHLASSLFDGGSAVVEGMADIDADFYVSSCLQAITSATRLLQGRFAAFAFPQQHGSVHSSALGGGIAGFRHQLSPSDVAAVVACSLSLRHVVLLGGCGGASHPHQQPLSSAAASHSSAATSDAVVGVSKIFRAEARILEGYSRRVKMWCDTRHSSPSDSSSSSSPRGPSLSPQASGPTSPESEASEVVGSGASPSFLSRAHSLLRGLLHLGGSGSGGPADLGAHILASDAPSLTVGRLLFDASPPLLSSSASAEASPPAPLFVHQALARLCVVPALAERGGALWGSALADATAPQFGFSPVASSSIVDPLPPLRVGSLSHEQRSLAVLGLALLLPPTSSSGATADSSAVAPPIETLVNTETDAVVSCSARSAMGSLFGPVAGALLSDACAFTAARIRLLGAADDSSSSVRCAAGAAARPLFVAACLVAPQAFLFSGADAPTALLAAEALFFQTALGTPAGQRLIFPAANECFGASSFSRDAALRAAVGRALRSTHQHIPNAAAQSAAAEIAMALLRSVPSSASAPPSVAPPHACGGDMLLALAEAVVRGTAAAAVLLRAATTCMPSGVDRFGASAMAVVMSEVRVGTTDAKAAHMTFENLKVTSSELLAVLRREKKDAEGGAASAGNGECSSAARMQAAWALVAAAHHLLTLHRAMRQETASEAGEGAKEDAKLRHLAAEVLAASGPAITAAARRGGAHHVSFAAAAEGMHCLPIISFTPRERRAFLAALAEFAKGASK